MNPGFARTFFLLLCILAVTGVAAEDTTTVTTTAAETLAPTTAVSTTLHLTTEAPTATATPTTETPTATLTTPLTTVPETTPTPDVTITVDPIGPGSGKGWIDTYCNVDGAAVYFDGSAEGTINGGILSVAVATTGTPIRTISVSKAGYTTWSGPLSRMPAENQHVAVYATINPIATTTVPTTIPQPQTGSIYAQSSPPGAAIYMNGEFYGYSPLTIPNLYPNSYSMRASLDGYSSDATTVQVYSGQTAPYYPVLSPSPSRNTGTVTVTSNPTYAQVYVDDTYKGKSPVTVTLYPGTHTFRITLAGYNDYTTSIYVGGGSSQTLNALLTPAVYGTLAITSMPGAWIYIDSNQAGIIPSSGLLTIYNVANGNRLIKVTAAGYNDWLNTVYIQPNVVTSINAVLTPTGSGPAPVTKTGSICITTQPAGADIYIDNLFRGYSPSVIDSLSAGQHAVLLKYTGYVDYSTTTTITPEQTAALSVAMSPAPTPTAQGAPLPVPVAIGGVMIAGLIAGMAWRRT